MSVYVPHEWIVDNKTDLSDYATKNELLNYVERDVDGSVNLGGKKLSGCALPTDRDDAANKQYVDGKLSERVSKTDGSVMSSVINMNGHKILNLPEPSADGDAVNKGHLNAYVRGTLPKSLICMTAEAAGELIENTPCFSFGANAYKFVRRNGGLNENSGIVMPTSGRVRYFTVTSTDSSGNPPPHDGITFALLVNGTAIHDPSQVVTIPSGQSTGFKTFHRDFYRVNTGDTINFHNLNNSPFSFSTVISVFIELDM